MNIVLESTRSVMDRARHVSIDDSAIERWARDVTPAELKPGTNELLAQLPGTSGQIANLILLIDALNFCFWSADPIRFKWRERVYERYEAMLVSILLAAKFEPRWFDAEYWVSVPKAELRGVLCGTGELLLLDERERIVRDTGRVLLERFDGQFIHAVESVNHGAWPLAVLLMTNFDSFRDVSAHRGSPVYFMKRPQICAIDLSEAWRSHGHIPLNGLEELTAFADYRVPQALRHLGVLSLNEKLAVWIENGNEIVQESEEEIEIRAATIQAADRMVKALSRAGKRFAAWEVDWYLWGMSHADDIKVSHHRTRTVYY